MFVDGSFDWNDINRCPAWRNSDWCRSMQNDAKQYRVLQRSLQSDAKRHKVIQSETKCTHIILQLCVRLNPQLQLLLNLPNPTALPRHARIGEERRSACKTSVDHYQVGVLGRSSRFGTIMKDKETSIHQGKLTRSRILLISTQKTNAGKQKKNSSNDYSDNRVECT